MSTDLLPPALLSESLGRAQILQRWSAALQLQCGIEAAERLRGVISPGAADLVELREQRLCLEFDRVFATPVALMAFWKEIQKQDDLSHGSKCPWPAVASMAHDFMQTGRIDRRATASVFAEPGPVETRLRRHAHDNRGWPDCGGIDYVLRQRTDLGLWTSIPLWANDVQEVSRVVAAGYLHGQPRWAVAIFPEGRESTFLCGLDAKGANLSALEVSPDALATWGILPHQSGPSAVEHDPEGVDHGDHDELA